MEDIYIGDCTFFWMINDVWKNYILSPLFQCSEVALATCLGIFSLVRFFNQIFLKRFLTKYFWKQISPKIWLPNLAENCFPKDLTTKYFWKLISPKIWLPNISGNLFPQRYFHRIFLRMDFLKDFLLNLSENGFHQRFLIESIWKLIFTKVRFCDVPPK